jgi:arylsulfatase
MRAALRCLAACAAALPLVACAGQASVAAWERVDLWSLAPRVVRAAATGKSIEATVGLYGPAEVRDRAQLTPRDLQRVPNLLPPRSRMLRQVAGSVVAWKLRLGRSPYLAIAPLPDVAPCPARGTIEVIAGGAPVVLWSGPAPASWMPAPPELALEMRRWAGREVEIRLGVEAAAGAAPGCAMQWGAPELLAVGAVDVATPSAERPPNILLIGVDTLRADALGAWGRRPSVTPALDRLAAESDVWTHAFSTVNATNQSFASIHTGLYVHHHGVHDLETPLPEAHATLAERLGEAGYESRAILAAQHLGPHNSGLDQGFDELVPAENTSSARLVVDQALDWLDGRGARPFFLWLHLFDPHTPHTPPDPYASGNHPAGDYGLGPVLAWRPFRALGPRQFREPRLGGDRDLYAGEVAFVDRQVDRLLGWLRERGMLRHTLVAFVADHGENLEDHGVTYRHSGLWDTTTRVPLMVRWPGDRPVGRRFDGLVQTIDLYPTLLGAARVPVNAQDGQDLRLLARGRRAVFSEQADGKGASVRTRRFRYFESIDSKIVPPGPYLYDLAADPGELTNLAGTGRPEEAELRALLQRWRATKAARAPRGNRPLSPEDEAELRALGYL